MKANYHTHTERCHHAIGKDEEFVKSAIKGGYKELGFSDHAPWKYDNPNFDSPIRMNVEEFDGYYNSLIELKEKYKDKINILIGLEVEYYPRYMEWMKNFILEKKLDYIIFGNHFDGSDEDDVYFGRACDDDEVLIRYKDTAIEGLKTGLYSYLAHPDLFMRGRHSFDKVAKQVSRELCEACKEMNIPLEYNLAGAESDDRKHVTQYPHPEFWKIAAEVGNVAIIGVDAHSNLALERNYYYDEALKKLTNLGIEIIEQIPKTDFKEIIKK